MGIRNEVIRKLEEENQIQSARISELQEEIRMFKHTLSKYHNIIEQQRKRLLELDKEIRVGDEVETKRCAGITVKFIVTCIGHDGSLYGIETGGSTHSHDPDGWKKTGRHFDIIGMLEKMVNDQ